MTFSSKLVERSVRFQEVISACRAILKDDPMAAGARDYLDSRLSKEAQERYGFGYFPSDDYLDKLTGLVGHNLLQSLLLVYPKYTSGAAEPHGHFHRHNLIMPFRNAYGDVVSIVGRTLLSSEAQKEQELQKYKYSFGANKQLYLFGIDRAKKAIIESDFVICVEGQFDCIACHEHGINNVVACGGADLLPFQFFQLHRYTNNLVLLLDKDVAGKRARVKIKKRYSPYAQVGAMTLPGDYKDIDELLLKSSPSERERVISILKNLRQQIGKGQSVTESG